MEGHERFWNCGGSSADSVFWVSVFGGPREKWWFKLFINPTYRVGRALNRAKYWVYYRIRPSHKFNVIHTGLKPGYYDPSLPAIFLGVP